VLDLIKDGLTNAEIAARLNISFDTAKFHVSEIITKLGVENREEAAAWQGRPRLQLGWAPALGALQKVAAAGVVVAAVAAAVLLLWKQPDKPAVLLPPGIYIAGPNGDALLRVDLTEEPVWSFDWSEDGRTFVTRGQNRNDFVRTSTFDAADGAVLDQTDVPEVQVDSPKQWPSPDGKTLALYNSEGAIELRDIQSTSLIVSIDGYNNFDFGIQWSPDSNWLALMQGPYDPQKSTELRVVSRQPSITPHVVSPAITPVDYDNRGSWLDWAPDSRSLAFVRDGRIWSLDVATGTVRQVSSSTFPVLTEPRWSPDGTQLAFRSASIASLYTATIDGKTTQYLAPVDSAAISPDGKRIATLSGGVLATQRSDGSDPKIISDFSGSHIEFMTDFFPSGYCGMQFPGPSVPSWSPDSKHLLVTAGGGDPPTIHLLNSNGSRGPTPIAEGYHPRWSPDGKHISYVRDCKVYILSFNGSDAADVRTTIDGYVYEWRQDGNLLIGLSSLGRGTQPDGASVYQPDGTRLLTVPGRTVPGNVRLSPNGDLIALTTSTLQPNDTRFFQTVIQATPSGQTLWTLDNVSSVTFSPDSRLIAYEAGPCCNAKLYVLDVSLPGSTPQLITTARTTRHLAWSPDSQKLAFTHRPTEQSGADILAVFDVRTENLTAIAPDASNVQWFPDSERLLFDTGPR